MGQLKQERWWRLSREDIIRYNENRSTREAQENGAKGGVASGVSRRRKKSLKEAADYYLSLSPTENDVYNSLALDGIEVEDIDNQMALVAGMTKAAIGGDAKAAKVVVDIIGKDDDVDEDGKLYELPARVIGKAFCDINRNIKPNIAYVFEGGRAALKSSFISLKIIELIKNNPQMHACVTRQVAATLKDSVYNQIKWAINELGLNDEFTCKVSPLEIIYKKTGQTIYFRGLDDEMKLKGIKPTFGYVGILWKEEKDQMKGPAQERSVNQSVLRGGDISYDFSSYNPPKSKSAWVHKEKLTPNEKRVIHHSTYLEAPPEWLGTKFIEDAEHLKEVNPIAYEHEYLGVANGDGGNVFEYLEVRSISDEEIKRMDRIYQGVDFGWYPDQFAFLRTYYDSAREKIYLLDELYVNKWSNAQTAEWIQNNGYDDYAITCDSAEPKSVNDYRDAGLQARGALKGPGSVEYGFKWLQSRTLVIDPKRTPNAYAEIVGYEYERDRDGNVISGYPDKNDHAISALRYAYESKFNKRDSSA